MAKHRYLAPATQKVGNTRAFIKPIANKQTPEQIDKVNNAQVLYKLKKITTKQYYTLINN